MSAATTEAPPITEPSISEPIGGAEPEAPYPTPSVPYWPEPCYARTPEWCNPSDYDLHPITEAFTLPATGTAEILGTSFVASLALLAGVFLTLSARRTGR